MNDELKQYIDVYDALEIVARYTDLDSDTEGEMLMKLLDKSISFIAKEDKNDS